MDKAGPLPAQTTAAGNASGSGRAGSELSQASPSESMVELDTLSGAPDDLTGIPEDLIRKSLSGEIPVSIRALQARSLVQYYILIQLYGMVHLLLQHHFYQLIKLEMFQRMYKIIIFY